MTEADFWAMGAGDSSALTEDDFWAMGEEPGFGEALAQNIGDAAGRFTAGMSNLGAALPDAAIETMTEAVDWDPPAPREYGPAAIDFEDFGYQPLGVTDWSPTDTIRYRERLPYHQPGVRPDSEAYDQLREMNELATGAPDIELSAYVEEAADAFDAEPTKENRISLRNALARWGGSKREIDAQRAEMQAKGFRSPDEYLAQRDAGYREEISLPEQLIEDFGRGALDAGAAALRGAQQQIADVAGMPGSFSAGQEAEIEQWRREAAQGELNEQSALPSVREGARFVATAAGSAAPAIGAAVITKNPTTAYSIMAGQAYGGAYDRARRKGWSPPGSTLYGGLIAGIEYATEKLGGVVGGRIGLDTAEEVFAKLGREAIKKGVWKRTLEGIGGSVIEGGEEALSEYAKSAADVISGMDPEAWQQKNPLLAAIAGFVIGGSAHSMQGVAAKFQNFIEEPTRENAGALGIPKEAAPKQDDLDRIAEAAKEQIATEAPSVPQDAFSESVTPEPPLPLEAPQDAAQEAARATEAPTPEQAPTIEPITPAIVGDVGGGIVDGYYNSLQQSLEQTGEVPGPERKSNVGLLWSKVKGSVAPEDFVIALRASQPQTADDYQSLARLLSPPDAPPASVSPSAPADSGVADIVAEPKKKRLGDKKPKPAAQQYDYSSTQVNLPGEVASRVLAEGAKIPDSDLAADGREAEPHVTVKYGLETNDAEAVRAFLADEPPIRVKLGKTTLFPAPEGGEYDVVKVDVESADLRRINKKIADNFPNKDTHPTYKPHVTLAYVKPGRGKQYAGTSELEGEEFVIDKISFRGKDGTRLDIPLTGKTKKRLGDRRRSAPEFTSENIGETQKHKLAETPVETTPSAEETPPEVPAAKPSKKRPTKKKPAPKKAAPKADATEAAQGAPSVEEAASEATPGQETLFDPDGTKESPVEAAASEATKSVNDWISRPMPPGVMGITPKKRTGKQRIDDTIHGASLKSDDQEVERQWQASKHRPTYLRTLDAAIEGIRNLGKSFTRRRVELDPKRFGATLDVLRRIEGLPVYAKARAAHVLRGVVAGMGPKKYDLLSRVLILRDLKKDVDRGLYEGSPLPFSYTPATLQSDLAKFEGLVQQNPDVADAIERRQQFMTTLRNELVERGLLPEKVKEFDDYFHHQVLQYLEGERFAGGPRRVAPAKKGWMRRRTGSEKNYNTEYLDAEFAVVSQALEQLALQDLIKRVELLNDVQPMLREAFGEEWRKNLPEGFVTWQPVKGNIAYPAMTVSEKALQNFLEGAGVLTEEDFRQVWALGGKRKEWVIPQELAHTLDNFKPRAETAIEKALGFGIGRWKKWVLTAPHNAPRYNLNNTSGDVDAAFAFNPRIVVQYSNQARKDTWEYHMNGGALTPELARGIELSVLSSGPVSEINQDHPSLTDHDYFSAIHGHNKNLVKRLWKSSEKFTAWREDVLRMAAWRFFRDQLDAGKTLYGATTPSAIDQMRAAKEPNDVIAARLARDLLGDYGNISEAGTWMRSHLIPFYSWCVPIDTEILTRDGWKTHEQVQIGEEALTYNLEKRITEWQPVQDKAVLPYDGEMISLTNSFGHNYQFTPDHRVVVIEQYGDKRKIVLGKDLKTHHKIPLVAPHEFDGAPSPLSAIEASLLGWLVTDGYFRWKGNSFESMVYQSPKKHAATIRRRFANYITSESVHPDTGVICFRLSAPKMARISALMKSKADLPRIVTRLDKIGCMAMYGAMMDAEGTVGNGCTQFPQVDGPVIDAFQILCYRQGKVANIRDRCKRDATQGKCVYVKDRDRLSIFKWTKESIPYAGLVWCPKTPNGTWVMRQSGKVMITGNCEINAPRYWRLLKNAPLEGGSRKRVAGVIAKKAATKTATVAAGQIAKRTFQMGAFYALANAWNLLVMGDLEDELPDDQKRELHLITGRDPDGTIRSIRLEGALSDALSWIGLQDLPADIADLIHGKATAQEKIVEAAKAPINRIVQGSSPIGKSVIESALGGATFPDVFDPRPIRDSAEHIARLLIPSWVYRKLVGKPSHVTTTGEMFGSLITYATDPGEAAYYTLRNLTSEWQKERGDDPGSFRPGAKANALYYHKQALKYGDKELAEKWLNNYYSLGGSEEGIEKSIKASDPIGSLSKMEKAEFLSGLKPEEMTLYKRAHAWYQRTYRPPKPEDGESTADYQKRVEAYDADLKDPLAAVMKDAAAVAANQAVLGHGRPEQKQENGKTIESDADFQKRASAWRDKRQRARQWLQSHRDSPEVQAAEKTAKAKIPLRPKRRGFGDKTFARRTAEWFERYGK